MLDPAPAPEGARGVAVGRGRPGAPARARRGGAPVRRRDRLPRRRHRRVRGHRARVLLPRAERADPGRAPGDRGGDRARSDRRADPDRRGPRARGGQRAERATRSRCGCTPRIRARFLPQSGHIERLRLPGSVRVDRGVDEGDTIGTRYDPMIAKLIAHGADAGGGDRKAARGARGDRGRRCHDEPAVPALARRSPGVPCRRHDDRLPHALPAAFALSAGAARAVLAGVVPAQPPGRPGCGAAGSRRSRACPRRAARSTTRSWPRCRGR